MVKVSQKSFAATNRKPEDNIDSAPVRNFHGTWGGRKRYVKYYRLLRPLILLKIAFNVSTVAVAKQVCVNLIIQQIGYTQ